MAKKSHSAAQIIGDSENYTDLFLKERYQIVEKIGSGGMGEVYLAEDTALNNEKVAIKFLRPELLADKQKLGRFSQEIILARKVTSPHVVKAFDAEISADAAYFVLEYVEGYSLTDAMEKMELSVECIVTILHALVIGLEAIHQQKIIHRDIKPDNILITNDGQIKITDLGVAKFALSPLTEQGEIIGSSSYISPEMWQNETVSDKSDIYSLGVLLYEMLCGQLPFAGDTMAQVMYQHLEGGIDAPHNLNPDVPHWLSMLTEMMLEIDPADRPELETIEAEIRKYHSAEITEFRPEKSVRATNSQPHLKKSGTNSTSELISEQITFVQTENSRNHFGEAAASTDFNHQELQDQTASKFPAITFHSKTNSLAEIKAFNIFGALLILACALFWINTFASALVSELTVTNSFLALVLVSGLILTLPFAGIILTMFAPNFRVFNLFKLFFCNTTIAYLALIAGSAEFMDFLFRPSEAFMNLMQGELSYNSIYLQEYATFGTNSVLPVAVILFLVTLVFGEITVSFSEKLKFKLLSYLVALATGVIYIVLATNQAFLPEIMILGYPVSINMLLIYCAFYAMTFLLLRGQRSGSTVG